MTGLDLVRPTAGDPQLHAVLEATIGPDAAAAGFTRWWERRMAVGRFTVERVAFDELDSWSFDEVNGALRHASGRFFSVEGLQASDGSQAMRSQPVINQPEIGLLGIIVARIDGVLHCLMQAKMEPGNVNTLQLSPTVQATRSNYTQVHRGASTRYLEHFVGPRRGRVLVDVLQSEQGAWFWHKRNRNIVIEVDPGDVEVHEDFWWLPLAHVRALLGVDNLINMDTRTVLSCLPVRDAARADADPAFAAAMTASYDPQAPALHPLASVLSWFTDAKTRRVWTARLVPLQGLPGWTRTDDEITDDTGRDFRIIAVRVAAANREVPGWSQPLLYPRGEGLAVFVTRRIRGVLHLLVHARSEFGLLDAVEMAPTVQLTSGEDPAVVDSFVRDFATAGRGRVVHETVQSEEGGRFHHALTRNRIVEVGDEFPVDVPPDFCWVTTGQLLELLRHGHYVNVEARSLLACLHSL